MPWIVRERDGRHCVYKEGADGEPTGDALACHDTKEEARRHQSALYANEPASKSDLSSDDTLIYVGESVKVLGGGKVGGILVPFGDPSTADAHGDYFTDLTDYGLDISTKARVIYHHGFTKAFGRRRLGVVGMGIQPGVGVMAVDPVQLDLTEPAQRDIYAKAEAGEMFWSTGTAHHLMARRPNGPAREIVSWPITECSLTPRPANRMARAMALKALIDGGTSTTSHESTGEANPGAVAAPHLGFVEFSRRLGADSREFVAVARKLREQRMAEGRDLSSDKLDAIKAELGEHEGVVAALRELLGPIRVKSPNPDLLARLARLRDSGTRAPKAAPRR